MSRSRCFNFRSMGAKASCTSREYECAVQPGSSLNLWVEAFEFDTVLPVGGELRVNLFFQLVSPLFPLFCFTS